MSNSKTEYSHYNDGIEYVPVVDRIMEREKRERTRPDLTVGAFGVIDSDANPVIMFWKVDGSRKDSKHGYTGVQGFFDRNTKALLESMFKGW